MGGLILLRTLIDPARLLLQLSNRPLSLITMKPVRNRVKVADEDSLFFVCAESRLQTTLITRTRVGYQDPHSRTANHPHNKYCNE